MWHDRFAARVGFPCWSHPRVISDFVKVLNLIILAKLGVYVPGGIYKARDYSGNPYIVRLIQALILFAVEDELLLTRDPKNITTCVL